MDPPTRSFIPARRNKHNTGRGLIPLEVSKYSYDIKKHHKHRPKPIVVHADASSFKSTVIRLTGLRSTSQFQDIPNSGKAPAPAPAPASPDAMMAVLEKERPSDKETRRSNMQKEILVGTGTSEVGRIPGILSPAPEHLPEMSAKLFSPEGQTVFSSSGWSMMRPPMGNGISICIGGISCLPVQSVLVFSTPDISPSRVQSSTPSTTSELQLPRCRVLQAEDTDWGETDDNSTSSVSLTSSVTAELSAAAVVGNSFPSVVASEHSSAVGAVKCVSSVHSTGFGEDKTAVGECWSCLRNCGIFPEGYEIDQETLVQLWVAAGWGWDESEGYNRLRELERRRFLSLLTSTPYSGKVWYKITRSASLDDEMSSSISHAVDPTKGSLYAAQEGGPCCVTVQHSSIDLERLKRFTQMRRLLFLRGHGCCFERLPNDFFISLKHLDTLDLSETRLLELPSSIGNARYLCYLDLSKTLIKQLPETIGNLHHLQTLKLRKCHRLVALPRSTRKLTALLYLDYDSPCRLSSMPSGMGALTGLRLLSEFPVSMEPGCKVTELNNMNSLRGSFCISKLENVASSSEAREANLRNKPWLERLELRWSLTKRQNYRLDNEIIEHLRPHKNLQHLRILCYRGLAFPSWISDSFFVNLVSITLFKCENCKLLPSLGKLQSLESLSLYELGVKIIDFEFCRDPVTSDCKDDAVFPRLQKLEITSMYHLEEWRNAEDCDLSRDFPHLAEIKIKDCPKLVALWRLLDIRQLTYLEITNCVTLLSLPQGDPLSLETLIIEGCPLLTSSRSRWENNQGWLKAAHVPNFFMDQLQSDAFLSPQRYGVST